MLDVRWCYQYTRFAIVQLSTLHAVLNLPPVFHRAHRYCCSSEEGLIVTLAKLATGFTNVKLCDEFGERDDRHISAIYSDTIDALDDRSNGVCHGNCLGRWVEDFPLFSAAIARKLSLPEYAGHHFNDFSLWLHQWEN